MILFCSIFIRKFNDVIEIVIDVYKNFNYWNKNINYEDNNVSESFIDFKICIKNLWYIVKNKFKLFKYKLDSIN